MNKNCYLITSTGSLVLKNKIILNYHYGSNSFLNVKDYQNSERWLNNLNLKSHQESLKELKNYRDKLLSNKNT